MRLGRDRLSNIVGQLKETSRGLKTATGEILSGANDLSERTTKQAATIEETSAAMEQLATTVLQNAFGFNPCQQFESMGKQNIALFENAMRMFNPCGTAPNGQPMPKPPAAANGQESPKPETAAAPTNDTAIDDLKRKLDELQAQLSELGKKS